MRLDDGWHHLIDAKSPLDDGSARPAWDVLVSAYNETDRVRTVFGSVPAARRIWWLLAEYAFGERDEVPAGALRPTGGDEAEVIDSGLAASGIDHDGLRVCIDITGFLPPYILYFLRKLPEIGLRRFDMIYTEPLGYAERAETLFSLTDVDCVRQVAGFGGLHVTDMSSDVLIVGVGYDHELIGHVVLEKESAQLVQLQCLPSLSADMYNESLLRLDRLSIPLDGRIDEQLFFTAANDPYVTASVLTDAVASMRRAKTISNLYLSPLATKPQVLGFGLFHVRECRGSATSVIYPFSARHSRGSSTGVGRTWVYPVDLT